MEHVLNLLRKNAACILFFIFYTAAFWAISRLFWLLLPVLLGALLYFASQPLLRLIRRCTKLPEKYAAYGSVGACTLLVLLLLTLLILLLYREIMHLFRGESYFRIDALLPPVQKFIGTILARIPSLTKTLTDDLSGTLNTVLPYTGSALKYLLSVPAALITPVLAFSFTAFFISNRRKLRRLISIILKPKNHLRLRHTVKKQSANSAGLVFSYMLIYLTTFAESCIVLRLLNMPYPLITALFATVSDVFPVLGPGAVLLPLCVYRLLCGAYAQAIGLLAGWLLITVIRQIIEPRLISKISRTPGIAMLSAVYAGFIFGNFWIIPYTALFFYLYRLFSDAGLLIGSKPYPRQK